MGENRFAMAIEETGLRKEELHSLQCTLGKEFLGSYQRKNDPVSGNHLSSTCQKRKKIRMMLFQKVCGYDLKEVIKIYI